jgi:rhodanese-related sulfurtransferase
MNVDFWKFAHDNIFLIAIAAISGGMLLWPLVRRGAGGATVTTHEATLLVNKQDGVIVDLRDARDYDGGHIPNARNIPLGELEQRLRDLEKLKSKPVIVHCDTGNRSGSAAAVLRRNGFEKVYTLAGGLAAWRQAGLPTAKAQAAASGKTR